MSGNERPILAHITYSKPWRHIALSAACSVSISVSTWAAYWWSGGAHDGTTQLCIALILNVGNGQWMGNSLYKYLRTTTWIAKRLDVDQVVYCANSTELDQAIADITGNRKRRLYVQPEHGGDSSE